MRRQIQLNERDAMLTKLALGLAHQLRNALTGARMAVQIHERKCPAPSADAGLSVALRQLTLVEEQVKGLLALGKPNLRGPEPIEPAAAIREVIDLVSPYADHHHVAITSAIESPGGSRAYMGDREAIVGAVLNLVLNAIDAAGGGGAVRLRLEERPESFVIEVGDTGPGPSTEIATTMFDSFVTGKPEGVGLGLALAKRVAEDHGGSLAWRRESSQTVFTLEAGCYR